MSSQGPQSTSTTSVPDWMSQYAQGYLNAGGQAAQMPYQPYTGPRVADLTPTQLEAINGIGALGNAAIPYYQSAGNALYGMLGNDQNPYTQQVVDRTTRQAMDAYANAVAQTSSRYNTPGNWGSTRQNMRDELNQRALATGLGDAIGSLNSQEFNNSRNRQLQAVGALNSALGAGSNYLTNAIQAGDVQRNQLQNVYNTAYGDFREQRDYPWTQLERFGGLLGSMTGAVPHTTTSQQGYDPVSQGLGLWQLGSTVGKSKGGSGTSAGGGFGSDGSWTDIAGYGS